MEVVNGKEERVLFDARIVQAIRDLCGSAMPGGGERRVVYVREIAERLGSQDDRGLPDRIGWGLRRLGLQTSITLGGMV